MLIAVDTNVLLDQALADEDVLDALALIRDRLQPVRFIVTPTVLQELAWIADNGDTAEEQDAAKSALANLQEWGYEPLNVVPVGNGIVEQIGLKLRMRGVVPDEEENDACIIAEAALIGCTILLSSDGHLLEAQEHNNFRSVLADCDVEGDQLVIGSPRLIVQKFFRRH